MTKHKTEDYKNSAVIGIEMLMDLQIFIRLLIMR